MKRIISVFLILIMLAGVVIVPGVTASAADIKTGTLVTFGSYPQTSVVDSGTLAKLNAQSLSWKYYDYYCDIKGDKKNYMKYADVSLSGERYRAVTFTHYRLYSLDYSSSSDINGYEPGKVYWFRYDPIVWRVLDANQGLLMAENIIDSQPFHNVYYKKNGYGYGDQSYTHYASNWAYSSLRSWMNGDFYDTAFGAEKSYIKTTSLTTPSRYLSEYDADPTNDDRVYLLSRDDALNESYGFSSDFGSGADTNRIAYGTDYARCQGLFVNSSTDTYYDGASLWLLRNPCYHSTTSCVGIDGYVDINFYYHITYDNYFGVRPALNVDLQSALSQSLIKITNSNNLVINGPSGAKHGFQLSFDNGSEYFTAVNDNRVYTEGADTPVPLSVTLDPGDTEYTGNDIVWNSSDPETLTVTSGGAASTDTGWTCTASVSPLKPGTVTVTASIPDVESVTATVTITDGPSISFHGEYYAYVGEGPFYLCEDAEDDTNALFGLTLYFYTGETDYTLDDLEWTVSDPDLLRIVPTGGGNAPGSENTLREMVLFKFLALGDVEVTVSLPGTDVKDSATFKIRQHADLSATYDAMQYYVEGSEGEKGIYSQRSMVSEHVDIYLLISNKSKYQDTESENIQYKPLKNVRLTAQVDGSGLKFETGTNKYTALFDEIEYNTAVDDLLTLYPVGIKTTDQAKDYTVTVTLESPDFVQNITEQYTFTLTPVKTAIEQHLDYINNDSFYKLTKKNYYGSSMSKVKGSKEYYYDRFISLDFENYYEVVISDLLMNMLNVKKIDMYSMLPELVSKTIKCEKQLIGDLSTILKDEYLKKVEFDETEFEKYLAKNKYFTGEAEDEFRDLIDETLKNVPTEKINAVFAKIDKVKHGYNILKHAKNIGEDVINLINKIALINTFVASEEEFKDVIKALMDSIPNNTASGIKMRSALSAFVNADNSKLDYWIEIADQLEKSMFKMTLDVFAAFVGKSWTEYIGIKGFQFLGSIKVGSAMKAFSTFPQYTTLQAGIGGVLVGYSLGQLASDLLCDTKTQTSEICKMVAVAEYSQYVIDVLESYEKQIGSAKTDQALQHYEYAYLLHKSVQDYLSEHTAGALSAKADSAVMGLFSYFDWFGAKEKKSDYDDTISAVLADQQKSKDMKCHSEYTYKSSVKNKTKVLRIFCPVDVQITDDNGNVLVDIKNNTVTAQTADISVTVSEDKKFVAMNADLKCNVRITATDKGSMDYTVLEYDDEFSQTVIDAYEDVPLIKGREFRYTVSDSAQKQDLVLKEPDPVGQGLRRGDVNGDGDILANDARLALRASAKLETLDETQTEAADVNEDGDIHADDARQILRFSAKLQNEFIKKK